MSAFARQIALPEVGDAGQRRLAQAHVLVVGAGGLGCPVLMYLATAGIGTLTVMDPDRVEATNLHRQPLYSPCEVGALKVEAAASALRRLAPALRLHALPAALGASNVAQRIADVDLVVDAADSFAVSYILSDACFQAGKVLISASVLGTAGYVGGYCGGAPSLRAVFPDLPERAATCASAGVMGPVVGMIGAAQAQLVLQQILATTAPAAGQLLSFDMGQLKTAGFRFDGTPEPADALPFVSVSHPAQDQLVVDLRPEREAPETVVQGAQRILPEEIATAELPRGRPLILACASGLRAWQAARVLQTRGYVDLSLHAVTAP
nr:HesA/MoeB/ThiF family protein [Tritonibacter horizontis]